MTNLSNSAVTTKLRQAVAGKFLDSRSVNFCVTVWQRKLLRGETLSENCTIMMDFRYGRLPRKGFSTNIKCKFGELDNEKFKVKGQEHKTLMLQEMKMRAEKAFIELRLTERNIDLELIKSVVMGLGVAAIPSFQHSLIMFFNTFEDNHKVQELEVGTLKKIKNWHRHISDFGYNHYGKDTTLDNVKPYDIKAFGAWLKKERANSHNVVQMISGHFKRFMDYAMENEWIARNPFMNFRRRFDIKKGEALTEKEVLIIDDLKLINNMDRVRDVFLFMCYTGLSFSDCRALRPNHFLKLESGETYIFKPREKTGREQTVYLCNRALVILQKYSNDNYCKQYGYVLPIVSNHKINLQLKAIGQIAAIKKIITSHMARRTYATIMYNAGLSELATKATMGHSSINMTLKHYATVEHKTVLFDIKEAFQRTKLG